MRIQKSTYSAPANVAEKFRRASSWYDLPAEAKAALRDLKEGETVTLTLPDGPRTLTLVRRIDMSEEEYERSIYGNRSGT
jgi:hypothetical protein